MTYTPARELYDVLLPAYGPCPGFESTCKDIARWNPRGGHVPRGFAGALSTLEEVEVVLIVAEPGDPYDSDPISPTLTLDGMLNQTCEDTFEHYRDGVDPFHRNMRFLLDLIFPNIRFEEQLKKAWITESYLCSALQEGGNVPAKAWRGCAERYLTQQLSLFQGLPVIALGGKAQQRASRYAPNLIKAYAIAPPGSNHKPARPSWIAAAAQAREMINAKERKITK